MSFGASRLARERRIGRLGPIAEDDSLISHYNKISVEHYDDHKALHRKSNYVFDVKDFGAKGDGVTDDTAAIQAAVDAATGPGDPAFVTRLALGPVFIPPGRYRVSAPIVCRSIQGLQLLGSGYTDTVLVPSGDFDCVLDFDGIAYARVQGLAVGDSSSVLDSAVRLDWTSAAHRSTTNVVFEGIWVRQVDVRAAFAVAERSPRRQVSEVTWRTCLAYGPGASIGGRERVGFSLGSGLHGNVLALNFYDSNVVRWDVGVKWDASNGNWSGGSIGHNGTDFVVNGAASEVSIQGVRSESSGRLLEGKNTGGVSGVSISDVQFHCNQLDPDDAFIRYGASGKLVLSNVYTANHAGRVPHVSMTNPRESVVVATGCAAPTPVEAFIADAGAGRLERILIGYAQMEADGPYPIVSGVVTL